MGDVMTKRNDRTERLTASVSDRDVKGVTRLLSRLLKDAGSDPTTSNYVRLAMEHLSAHRRDWDSIDSCAQKAIEAARDAEEEGTAEACIDYDTQIRDSAVVRAKQARQRLGMIPAGIFRSQDEETLEALETVQEAVSFLLSHIRAD